MTTARNEPSPGMATVRPAWAARIERAGHGGVYLIETYHGVRTCQQWFTGIRAAQHSPQGRQYAWRASGAAGWVGDLIQWGGNE